MQAAHARGLKARYWSVPEKPEYLRDRLWRLQKDLGVDMISTNSVRDFGSGSWLKFGRL